MNNLEKIFIISKDPEDRAKYEYFVANKRGNVKEITSITDIPIEHFESLDQIRNRLKIEKFTLCNEFEEKLNKTVESALNGTKIFPILVADDDEYVRNYLRNSLLYRHITVFDGSKRQILVLVKDEYRHIDVAKNEKEALDIFAKKGHSLILTDLWMPDKTFKSKYCDWNKPSILDEAEKEVLQEGFTGVVLIKQIMSLLKRDNHLQKPQILAFTNHWAHPRVQQLCASLILEECGIGILPKHYWMNYIQRNTFDRTIDLVINLRQAGFDASIYDGVFDSLKLAAEEIKKSEGFLRDEIVGQSKQIENIRKMISTIRDTDATILITGETGTGKGLVAKTLHKVSRRDKKPFIKVNCAAFPEGTLDSELFGHVKGAFTGANLPRDGKFKAADGGTIFLDEIGDLSLNAQAKILLAIEDKTFDPVGSEDTVSVDVRIIAATNKNLEEEVKAGTFRQDLLRRLELLPIHIPSLNERRGDIRPLIEHFVNIYSSKYNKKLVINEQTISMLEAYDWGGKNVRELMHIIERGFLLMQDGEEITPNILGSSKISKKTQVADEKLPKTMDEWKTYAVLTALRINNNNIVKAAEYLDVTRGTLYKILNDSNIAINKIVKDQE